MTANSLQLCPGRTGYYRGVAMIPRECIRCARRTELPVHMTGPQVDPVEYNQLWPGYCSKRVSKSDVSGVVPC